MRKKINLILGRAKSLFRQLKDRERVLVALCGLIFLFSVLGLWRELQINSKKTAAFGGTYMEGIISQNESEALENIKRLTNVGLLRYDFSGKIVPDLAQSYQISDEGKIYQFKLRSSYNSADIVQIAKSQKSIFPDVEIQNPDSETLKFILPQAYSPFLASTTSPIFPYGPYKIDKKTKNEINLSVRQNFYLGRPFINKIIIKFYADSDSLQKALKNGEIMGAGTADFQRRGFKIYHFKLPRYQVLFFNLQKDSLKDKGSRQKLKSETSPGQELELTLLTDSSLKNINKAFEIKDKWQKLEVKLNIISKDEVTLLKDDVPSRSYDLLLYGLDYGFDPDPYPFWHSSQTGEDGKNLSSFGNRQADYLLEQGRLEQDQTSRAQIYEQFQKILDDEVPAIFLEQEDYPYTVSDKVKGIVEGDRRAPFERFLDVNSWYIKEKRIKKI